MGREKGKAISIELSLGVIRSTTNLFEGMEK